MHRVIKDIFAVLLVLSCAACTGASTKSESNVTRIESESRLPFYMRKPNLVKASEINVQLGYGYLKQKQYSRAKSKFIHALDLQPKSELSHSGLAKYYQVVGEGELAEEHFLKAIGYAKRKAIYNNGYGIFLCEQNRLEESEKAFLLAIKEKTYENVAISYQNLATCMQSHNKIEKAHKYYEAALRHDPYLAQSTLELAHLSYDKNQLEQSWSYFARYRQTNNLDASSLFLGIRLASDLGHYDDAASYKLMLRSRFSDTPEYKKMLSLNFENKSKA